MTVKLLCHDWFHKPGGFSRSPRQINAVNLSNIEIWQTNVVVVVSFRYIQRCRCYKLYALSSWFCLSEHFRLHQNDHLHSGDLLCWQRNTVHDMPTWKILPTHRVSYYYSCKALLISIHVCKQHYINYYYYYYYYYYYQYYYRYYYYCYYYY